MLIYSRNISIWYLHEYSQRFHLYLILCSKCFPSVYDYSVDTVLCSHDVFLSEGNGFTFWHYSTWIDVVNVSMCFRFLSITFLLVQLTNSTAVISGTAVTETATEILPICLPSQSTNSSSADDKTSEMLNPKELRMSIRRERKQVNFDQNSQVTDDDFRTFLQIFWILN